MNGKVIISFVCPKFWAGLKWSHKDSSNDFINVDLITKFIKVTEVDNNALTFLDDDDDVSDDYVELILYELS